MNKTIWTVVYKVLLGTILVTPILPQIGEASTINANTSFVDLHPVYQESLGEPGLAGRSFLIDAGHGGPDGGAVGVNGELEKEINLNIAMELTTFIRQAGGIVYLVRDRDKDMATQRDREQHQRHLGDLRGRWQVVRKTKASTFVSIHCNSVPSPVWHGAQTLYFKDNEQGQALAETLQRVFQTTLLPTRNEVQKNDTLFLLKRIRGPAVLVESGFLSNAHEASMLATKKYQKQVAFAIYLGLLQYYGQSPLEND